MGSTGDDSRYFYSRCRNSPKTQTMCRYGAYATCRPPHRLLSLSSHRSQTFRRLKFFRKQSSNARLVALRGTKISKTPRSTSVSVEHPEGIGMTYRGNAASGPLSSSVPRTTFPTSKTAQHSPLRFVLSCSTPHGIPVGFGRLEVTNVTTSVRDPACSSCYCADYRSFGGDVRSRSIAS